MVPLPVSVTSMVQRALSVRSLVASVHVAPTSLAKDATDVRRDTMVSLNAAHVLAPPLHSVFLTLVSLLVMEYTESVK